MLTTPERSENSPPSAASPIGTASSSAAATVEDDVSACSPLITRMAASRTTAATAMTAVRWAVLIPPRRLSGPPPGALPGAPLPVTVATLLMPVLPAARRCARPPAGRFPREVHRPAAARRQDPGHRP